MHIIGLNHTHRGTEAPEEQSVQHIVEGAHSGLKAGTFRTTLPPVKYRCLHLKPGTDALVSRTSSFQIPRRPPAVGIKPSKDT